MPRQKKVVKPIEKESVKKEVIEKPIVNNVKERVKNKVVKEKKVNFPVKRELIINGKKYTEVNTGSGTYIE